MSPFHGSTAPNRKQAGTDRQVGGRPHAPERLDRNVDVGDADATLRDPGRGIAHDRRRSPYAGMFSSTRGALAGAAPPWPIATRRGARPLITTETSMSLMSRLGTPHGGRPIGVPTSGAWHWTLRRRVAWRAPSPRSPRDGSDRYRASNGWRAPATNSVSELTCRTGTSESVRYCQFAPDGTGTAGSGPATAATRCWRAAAGTRRSRPRPVARRSHR